MSSHEYLLEIRGFIPYEPTRTEIILENVLMNNGIYFKKPCLNPEYEEIKRVATHGKKIIEYSRDSPAIPEIDTRIPDEKIKIKNEDGRILPHIFYLSENINNSYFSETLRFELSDYETKPFDNDNFCVFIEKGELLAFGDTSTKEKEIKFLKDYFKSYHNYAIEIEKDKIENSDNIRNFLEIVRNKSPPQKRNIATKEYLTLEFIGGLVSFYFRDWNLLEKSF